MKAPTVDVVVIVGGHRSTFVMPEVDPSTTSVENADVLAYTHSWLLRAFGEAHRAWGRARAGMP